MADAPWLEDARADIGKYNDGPDVPKLAQEVGRAFPDQMAYAKIAGPSTSWCGIFVAAKLAKYGIRPPYDPPGDNVGSWMYVDAWKDWGTPVPIGEEQPGDVAVFLGGPHHVTFVAGDGNYIGGNQGDTVSEGHYRTPDRIRRPPVVDEGTDPMPPPSPDVDAAMARLNDVVAELRAQEARISALEKKPMPDTQPQPQIDWAAVLEPVVKALLPQLPKLLPLLMPLALQLITQWLAPKQPQGIAAVSGGTWATIAGAIATAVLGYGQARGVVPAEATLAAGGATLAAGGYAVKK